MIVKFLEIETCESTNDEAWKYVDSEQPILVLAHQQTRGRGRQGRSWVSENNSIQNSSHNITASLFLPRPRDLRWIPLAAGVCAVESIASCCRNFCLDDLRVKWPNDVYYEHAKLGGILCESRLQGEKAIGVVVGFGLNITDAPKLPEQQTIDLRKLSKATLSDFVCRELKTLIAQRWGELLANWNNSSDDLERLRSQWKHWAKLGEFKDLSVHYRGETQKIKVRALDLEPSGVLKVRLPSGEITLLDQADTL